jgi:hypothetical protein
VPLCAMGTTAWTECKIPHGSELCQTPCPFSRSACAVDRLQLGTWVTRPPSLRAVDASPKSSVQREERSRVVNLLKGAAKRMGTILAFAGTDEHA